MKNTNQNYLGGKDAFHFYFLDEKEFEDLSEKMKPNSRKAVSFCGHITDFEVDTNLAYVVYKNKKIRVNFGRVAGSLQLGGKKSGIYFIYGFLQKDSQGRPSAVCDFWRYVSDFNQEDFTGVVTERRRIMKECEEMNEENSFWNSALNQKEE